MLGCLQVSILCPDAPTSIKLPAASKAIRAIQPQPQSAGSYVAVGTMGAGLQVLSSLSDNVVQR